MKSKLFNDHVILWADDDADDLYLVKEVINGIDNKYKVVEAANGRQALDYLNAVSSPMQLPCLVVLDINMPILNGKETLAIIKSEERYRDIKVIVFTTSNNEKDRLFCERLGAVMFTKPHTYSGFKEIISEVLTLCKFRDLQSPSMN